MNTLIIQNCPMDTALEDIPDIDAGAKHWADVIIGITEEGAVILRNRKDDHQAARVHKVPTVADLNLKRAREVRLAREAKVARERDERPQEALIMAKRALGHDPERA